jgi:hypothetical protein
MINMVSAITAIGASGAPFELAAIMAKGVK